MTLLEALFANRRLRGALNKQRGLLTNIPGFGCFDISRFHAVKVKLHNNFSVPSILRETNSSTYTETTGDREHFVMNILRT